MILKKLENIIVFICAICVDILSKIFTEKEKELARYDQEDNIFLVPQVLDSGKRHILREAEFTSKLLRALRAHPALRDAVIWKLNDRTTRGIPDFVVVTSEGRTTWWEVKAGKNKLTRIQSYYLSKLRLSWCIILLKNDLITIQPQGVSQNSYCNFKMAIEAIAGRCLLKVSNV